MVNSPQKRSSSSGELAAVSGFSKQYEFAACKIFRLMQRGNLQWVSFGNSDVGMFDDAVICGDQRISAYQLKTSETPKSVSIKSELKKSELRGIFESYKKLVNRYGEQDITLNYVFAGYFSRQDKSLANLDSEGDLHTYSFVKYINEYNSQRECYTQSKWQKYLNNWKSISGFDEEAFVGFLHCIRFYDREEISKEKLDNFDLDAQEKIGSILLLIPKIVKGSKAKDTWLENELIEELGWQKPLAQKFNHIFPLPENYQDNKDTRLSLEKALTATVSGYVSLLGAPGSGKSSLLERDVKTSRNKIVVRYLSFHPDRRHGLGRGEASEFLNDIVVALGKTGLPAKRFQRSDLQKLRSHFWDQINAAGKRYEETGRKTVIVIDGLDHIPREEKPSESFLKILPLPHAIPEGVLFLLGSQKLSLDGLPQSIIQQASEADRKITVKKLKRSNIAAMIKKSKLSNIIKASEFYSACEGNPLITQYLLKALQNAGSGEAIQTLLSREHGIGGDIEQIYERLWSTIDSNHELHAVLGLLARAEGKISASELATETSEELVEDMLKRVSYLLQSTGNNRLTIFHNSFRLFLVEKTSTKFGRFDPNKDKLFNKKLANIATNANEKSDQRWLAVRYQYRAEEFGTVLEIATPTYFREQLKEFRPESEIYSDLRLAYGALKYSRDRTQLVRLLLVDKEISYRLEAISELDIIELLMDGMEIDKAVKIALDGSMYGDGWKALVMFLLELDQVSLARQIFELNEPVEVLYGERQYQGRNLTDEVETWIELARHFRPDTNILEIINAISIDTTFGDDPDVDVLRSELRYHLAFQVFSDDSNVSLEEIGKEYSLENEELKRLSLEAARHQIRDGDIERARKSFNYIRTSSDLNGFHVSWLRSAILIAEKVERDDIVSDLLNSISPVSIGDYSDVNFRSNFKHVLESRLFTSTLAKKYNVPDLNSESTDKPLARLIAKGVIQLSDILLDLDKKDPTHLGLELKSTIVFFGNVRSQDRYSTIESAYRSNVEWLVPKIFYILKRIGDKDITTEIIEEVLSLVAKTGSNYSSSYKFRLKLAEHLVDFPEYENVSLKLIEDVKEWSLDEYTPHEEVSTKAQVCKSLANIGKVDDARAYFKKIHEGTLGYWLRAKKEPQYLFWNLVFKKACSEQSGNTLQYSLNYAQFLSGMEKTEGRGTAYRMVDDLLRGASNDAVSFSLVFQFLFNSDSSNWGTLSAVFIDSLVLQDPSLAKIAMELYVHLTLPFLGSEFISPLEKILSNLSAHEHGLAIERLVASVGKFSPLHCRQSILEKMKELVPENASIIDDELSKAERVKNLLKDQYKERDKAHSQNYGNEYPSASLKELTEKYSGISKHSDGLDYSFISKARELVKTDSKAGIEDFLLSRPSISDDAGFLINAADRMYELTENQYANSLFSTAEGITELKSWSSYLGGEKLNLLKTRINMNGVQGMERGFDDLVKDLESGVVYGSSLFSDLDEIIELISPDIKWGPIWEEVQQHLRLYREFRLVSGIPLPKDTSRSYNETVADYLATALLLPCPTLQSFATKAAIETVKLDATGEILLSISETLIASEYGNRQLASIVRRVSDKDIVIKSVSEVCNKLIKSPDFVSSTLANVTLSKIGETITKTGSVDLPSFYSLDFANNENARDFTPPSGLKPYERPLWTEDPWTWTTVLERQCKLASDASGFSIETIRRRTAHFMKEMGGKSAFGPDAEIHIGERLKALDLPFSYSRPMPAYAILAFGKVINELNQAERIDPRVFQLLWKEMGGIPLSGFELKYESQPTWVGMPSIPNFDGLSNKTDDWLANADKNLTPSVSPNGHVLLEQSTYQINHWRNQYIITHVTAPKINPISKSEYPFLEFNMLYSIDSMQPIYSREDSTGICRVSERNSHTIPFDAITLCPFVIRELNWQRSKRNPFIISDYHGEEMAKTAFWKNGIGNLDPSSSEKEYFAEGQFLLINETAKPLLSAVGLDTEMHTQVHHRVIDEKRLEQDRFVVSE